MEAAKRREARRKKLLESSEDRFKRIERLKKRSQEAEDDAPDSGHNGSSVQDNVDDPSKSAPVAPISISQPSEEERALTRQLRDGEEDSQTQRAEISREPEGVSQNPIPRDVSQDSGFVDGPLTSRSGTQSCDKNETQHRSKPVETSAQHVVSLQTLVFSLLAVVNRLWLVSLIQGQSIIVLFFATEILLFLIGVEKSPAQSGPVRIITAILTFRGASPETVQRVQRCLGFCQGTLRDLSTFFFVFVMMHATMQGSSTLDQSESVP